MTSMTTASAIIPSSHRRRLCDAEWFRKSEEFRKELEATHAEEIAAIGLFAGISEDACQKIAN